MENAKLSVMKNRLHFTRLAPFFLLLLTSKIDAQQPEAYPKVKTHATEALSQDSVQKRSSVVKTESKTAGTLEAELNLYPNPSNRYINVTLPAQGKNADVEIQDLNGRVVKRYTNLSSVFQRFDITYLKAGVYIIKVVQDNKVYSKQFVIAQ